MGRSDPVMPNVDTVVVLGDQTEFRSTSVKCISWEEIHARPPNRREPQNVLSDDLAYVLYTSGSTGVPKGVLLTQKNACTFVIWMATEFCVSPFDRVASRSPLNFDLSVFDVFNSLAAGATLLVQERRRLVVGELSSVERHTSYVDFIRAKKATLLYTTPSTFITLLEKGGLDDRWRCARLCMQERHLILRI